MQIEFPNVSIIVLTYNGEKYIDALLESLSDQSYPKELMEIIVIDNASSDKTVDLVQKNFPHVKCILLERNVGFAVGNNKALQYAEHELMVFLNQDTICHRDWLKAIVIGMLHDEKIAACSSNIVPYNPDEFQNPDLKSQLNTIYYCDLSPYGYGRYYKRQRTPYVFTKIFSGCSFAIHRQTVNELGYLFDEQFWMYAEDTDLSLRIHNIGQRICVVKDSVVYHLHSSDVNIKKSFLSFSAKAIMNRVYAFFINMTEVEFILFFPLLFFGGILKIFEFPISNLKKALYFIPFSFFSMTCMLLSLLNLTKFAARRRLIMKNRQVKGFTILKLVLKQRV
jgi:GT2 family glycosyltransferase